MITDFTQGTLTLTLRRAGGETWTRRMDAAELPAEFVASPGDPAALRGAVRDLEGVPGQRIRWEIRAMEPCELLEASWAGTAVLNRDTRVFMNGWQSWTDGEEQNLSGRTPSLGPLGRLLDWKYHFSSYGDYSFTRQSRRRGEFHGWTWASLRGDSTTLLASLADRESFTSFHLDARPEGGPSSLTISRDVEGVLLDPRREGGRTDLLLLDAAAMEGREEALFDRWFAEMDVQCRAIQTRRGWTSWYKYYEDIDEEKILRALSGYGAHVSEDARTGKAPRPVFQIDDGWQTAVGDWLSIREDRFPRGLAPLSEEARQAGMESGLWLAPFAARFDSRVAREHPDWLVRDRKGRPIPAGSNWGGFYGLDPEHPGVRDYLKTVFRTVIDDWGFSFVKLDFLYAACMTGAHGFSRGELMGRAMDFLRETVGDGKILGCGVPLASAFGVVDYCRIGCDVSLDWDGSPAWRLLFRERPSTKQAIENTRGRRFLDRRAFLNDPDVWIGRTAKDVKLTRAQKELLRSENLKYGSLVFCSDDWDELPEEWRTLE